MTALSPLSPAQPAMGDVGGLAGALGGSGGSAAVSVLRDQTGGPGDLRDEQRGRVLGRHSGRLMQRRLLGRMGMRQHRLATCGFSMEPGRRFRVADGKARAVGVERCGNGRVCAVCGPMVATQRAAEVGAAVWRWLEGDERRGAYFVSIAASHRRDDKLADLVGYLLDARADVMNPEDPTWRAVRQRVGIADVAWTLEANIGANGPHPGLHLVLLTDRCWSAADVDGFEAFLCMAMRASMRALGFTGRLSAEHGIDVRPVDDPAGIGRYLNKWGIGAELTGEMCKLGRNGDNVPYSAIPSVLAAELGRQDITRVARQDRRVAALVAAWGDYVRLALSDKRKWYSGFHRLTTLVPELKGVATRNERVAICTEVLPEELRPERLDDAEGEDDGEPATMLTVEPDAWAVAQKSWWQGHGIRLVPWRWRRMAVPLELAVVWLIEDHGLDDAAEAVADLAGADLFGTEHGLTIAYQPVRTDRESPGQGPADCPYRAVRRSSQDTERYGENATQRAGKGGGGSFFLVGPG